MVINNNNSNINYILPGLKRLTGGQVQTQQLQKAFKDVSTEVGCFDVTFSLQVKKTVNHTKQHQGMWPMYQKATQGRTRITTAEAYHHAPVEKWMKHQSGTTILYWYQSQMERSGSALTQQDYMKY